MSIHSLSHTYEAPSLQEEERARARIDTRSRDIKLNPDSRLVFVTDPDGLAVERYKLLRRRLWARSPSGGMILVTSPSPGDGKTLNSINLAWCLADGGKKTCLVDLDFRAPSVATTLGLPFTGGGVTELLAGHQSSADLMCQVGDLPLYVLGLKEGLSSSSRQLASPLFLPWLKELRNSFEWVIFDMPPAIPISDVAEVLPHVDGALMVTRKGQTVKSLIAPALEILGPKLWGAVLNDCVQQGDAYYGNYGYGYGKKRGKK